MQYITQQLTESEMNNLVCIIPTCFVLKNVMGKSERSSMWTLLFNCSIYNLYLNAAVSLFYTPHPSSYVFSGLTDLNTPANS